MSTLLGCLTSPHILAARMALPRPREERALAEQLQHPPSLLASSLLRLMIQMPRCLSRAPRRFESLSLLASQVRGTPHKLPVRHSKVVWLFPTGSGTCSLGLDAVVVKYPNEPRLALSRAEAASLRFQFCPIFRFCPYFPLHLSSPFASPQRSSFFFVVPLTSPRSLLVGPWPRRSGRWAP